MMNLKVVEIVESELSGKAVGTPFHVTMPIDSVIVHAEREGPRRLFFHVAKGMATDAPRTLFLLSAGTANHNPDNRCEFVSLVIDRNGGRPPCYLFQALGMP